VVAPDLLLLDSKLSVPRPRPGFVSRAGLIEKARGGGCRVIGVTAPAGYGKSTLLVEWALAEDRPVVWVSFDRLDDDPALVLSLLASAYARAWPADAGLIADVSGAGVSCWGAPRLAWPRCSGRARFRSWSCSMIFTSCGRRPVTMC